MTGIRSGNTKRRWLAMLIALLLTCSLVIESAAPVIVYANEMEAGDDAGSEDGDDGGSDDAGEENSSGDSDDDGSNDAVDDSSADASADDGGNDAGNDEEGSGTDSGEEAAPAGAEGAGGDPGVTGAGSDNSGSSTPADIGAEAGAANHGADAGTADNGAAVVVDNVAEAATTGNVAVNAVTGTTAEGSPTEGSNGDPGNEGTPNPDGQSEPEGAAIIDSNGTADAAVNDPAGAPTGEPVAADAAMTDEPLTDVPAADIPVTVPAAADPQTTDAEGNTIAVDAVPADSDLLVAADLDAQADTPVDQAVPDAVVVDESAAPDGGKTAEQTDDAADDAAGQSADAEPVAETSLSAEQGAEAEKKETADPVTGPVAVSPQQSTAEAEIAAQEKPAPLAQTAPKTRRMMSASNAATIRNSLSRNDDGKIVISDFASLKAFIREDAESRAANNVGIETETTIQLTQDIEGVNDMLQIAQGQNIRLEGAGHTISTKSASLTLFYVATGGKLTFADVTSDGGSVRTYGEFVMEDGAVIRKTNGSDGAVYVKGDEALFTMKDGAKITENSGGNGTVRVLDNGTFVMEGGEISENINSDNRNGTVDIGGYLMGADSGNFYMSGGEIRNNKAYYAGGVGIWGTSHAEITGGRIADNKAVSIGGGIAVYSNMDSDLGNVIPIEKNAFFLLDGEGAVIEGNSAASSGGGLYIGTNRAYFVQGKILNNRGGQGGGIYIATDKYNVNFKNTLVTGNTANQMGGGIWACPTGYVDIDVNEGIAVFDNHTIWQTSAGDDIFTAVTEENYTITIETTALGGGSVRWYHDGNSIYPPDHYGRIGHAPRYGVVTEEYPDGFYVEYFPRANDEPGFAIKAIMDDDAKASAKNQAKVIIMGNHATRGGGIGTNGGMYVGPPPEEESKTQQIRVIKEWKYTPDEEQADVEIELLIDGVVARTATLTKDNQFEYVFENLPTQGYGTMEVVEKIVGDEGQTVYRQLENTGIIVDEEKPDEGNVLYKLVRFVNEKIAEPVKDFFSAFKTLEGRKLKDEEFSFVLRDAEGNILQTVTNNADGEILFEELTFDDSQIGEHHYTISEVEGTEEGISYDRTCIEVVVKVLRDETTGKLSTQILYAGEPEKPQFINTFTPPSIKERLRAEKQLEGRALDAGEFSFVLADEDGNILQTVTNDADGAVSFDLMEFDLTQVGTHTYRIYEAENDLENIDFDKTQYTVVITVSKDEVTGLLSASVEYLDTDNVPVFQNTFTPPPVRENLQAEKRLEGRELHEGEFSFVLTDEDGNVLQTVTNGEDGAISFEEMEFDLTQVGRHVYWIYEVEGILDNVTYDANTYTVIVTVSRDEKSGLLSAAVEYVDAEGIPVFRNTYTPPEEPPTPPTPPTPPIPPEEPEEPPVPPTPPTPPEEPEEPPVPPTPPTPPTPPEEPEEPPVPPTPPTPPEEPHVLGAERMPRVLGENRVLTGDESMMLLWGAVLLISALCAAGWLLMASGRRKRG